jgi:hypothetical protein
MTPPHTVCSIHRIDRFNFEHTHLDEYDDMPNASSKRGGGGGGGAAFSNSGAGLYPCSVCNRTFASDRIQQHESACRVANKKRRTFDSTKQRLQGTEAASFFRKNKANPGSRQPPGPSVRHDYGRSCFLSIFIVDPYKCIMNTRTSVLI